MSPEDFQSWLDVLGKPTLGVVAVFVLVMYRSSVEGFFAMIFSWFTRK